MGLREDLERLVIRNARLEVETVADHDVLGHDVGLDSHALLALLLDVEDLLGIEIPPEQVSAFAGIRFGAFCDLVGAAAGPRAPGP